MVNAIPSNALVVRAGGLKGISPLATAPTDSRKVRKTSHDAATAVASEPPARASSSGRKWTPKAGEVMAQARPAAAAVTAQAAPAKARPPAKAAPPALVQALTARELRARLSFGIGNNKIHKMNKSGIKAGYTSHTAHYQGDATFRAQCVRNGTPEWLVYNNGETARADGQLGDAFGPGL